jgi:hypothetical protein
MHRTGRPSRRSPGRRLVCPVPVRVRSDGLSLLLPDDVDRDLHRRNRSSVLKPVCGVPILGPAHPRPIIRSGSISMVCDRSAQYVDDAGSVLMVVNRAEDASRLDGHHTHSKLAPRHALDLRAKVNRRQYLRRNTLCLRCRLFVAHLGLLASRSARSAQPYAWPACWANLAQRPAQATGRLGDTGTARHQERRERRRFAQRDAG